MQDIVETGWADGPRHLAARPLEGRVAVVTGGTSGIGLGIAHALAAQGATLVLNDLAGGSDAETLCKDLGMRHEVPVRFDLADMADPDAIARLFENTRRALGPVEILINNAGIQHVAAIDALPRGKWDAVLAVNLDAIFHATRAVLPDMRRRGWGRIVNIASAHGLIGSPYKSAYTAAKHGVVGFTKVAALETAEQGVTCNAVCPGYVWTPLVERQVAAQAAVHGIPPEDVTRKVLLAEQPNRRFVTVREVAATVAFLCGPDAASITGAAIPVDGGWTAH